MMTRTLLLLLLATAARAAEFPSYIPEAATKEKPCPLVVACHGHGGTADGFLNWIKPAADLAGFAILAPEGTEKAGEGFGWNAFPDRAKVIEASIRALLKAHPEVDPKRIVWLGHSAGSWVCCQDGAPKADLCKGIVLTAAATAGLQVPTKGPRPRVVLFLGTEDANFQGYVGFRESLKAAKAPFSANEVKGLGHTLPDMAYLAAAFCWALEGEGANEENVLPKEPPAERACRHLLFPIEAKKTSESALKEARKALEAMKKEKPGKRKAKGEPLAAPEPLLLRWAWWTATQDAVRLAKGPDGWHLVWAE